MLSTTNLFSVLSDEKEEQYSSDISVKKAGKKLREIENLEKKREMGIQLSKEQIIKLNKKDYYLEILGQNIIPKGVQKTQKGKKLSKVDEMTDEEFNKYLENLDKEQMDFKLKKEKKKQKKMGKFNKFWKGKYSYNYCNNFSKNYHKNLEERYHNYSSLSNNLNDTITENNEFTSMVNTISLLGNVNESKIENEKFSITTNVFIAAFKYFNIKLEDYLYEGGIDIIKKIINDKYHKLTKKFTPKGKTGNKDTHKSLIELHKNYVLVNKFIEGHNKFFA